LARLHQIASVTWHESRRCSGRERLKILAR